MSRPSKTLAERVTARKFVARQHHELLAGPLVGPEPLRTLQERYRLADSDAVRRAIALEYEKALQGETQTPATEETGHGGDQFGVADFFERLLRHTKGPAAGQAFVLEPWQRRFVEEFDRRENGQRVFKRALLGVARGNGKSPLAAGLALRELLARDDSPDIFLAAAARDQARIVFEYARGFVEAGPLASVLQVGRHEIRNPRNDGVLRTISADGYVAHGLNPSAVIIDELHAWTTAKQRELLEAVDSAIHKRPDAFWLTITTAGHDKTSLLGRLFLQILETLELERPTPGLTIARDEFNGTLAYWYGADETANVDDEQLWAAVNPASWITVADLGRQRRAPSMSRSTFARLHLNAWVAPEAEHWLEESVWDELADPAAKIPEKATIYIGADGSRSYDTTAIAWAYRAPDGRIGVDARVFSVREEVPHHVLHSGGTIDYEDVEGFLVELLSRYRVAEVRFDPRFLEPVMDAVRVRVASKKVAAVEPYSGAHRLALQAFEKAVRDGTVRHRGDPAIAAQLANCGCDRFDNGDPRRLRKLDRARPIDASVALALATHAAVLGARVKTGNYIFDWDAIDEPAPDSQPLVGGSR